MFALCYLCYLAFASLLFWELFTVSPFDPCLEMFPQVFLFILLSFYHLFQILPIVIGHINMAVICGDEGRLCVLHSVWGWASTQVFVNWLNESFRFFVFYVLKTKQKNSWKTLHFSITVFPATKEQGDLTLFLWSNPKCPAQAVESIGSHLSTWLPWLSLTVKLGLLAASGAKL